MSDEEDGDYTWANFAYNFLQLILWSVVIISGAWGCVSCHKNDLDHRLEMKKLEVK